MTAIKMKWKARHPIHLGLSLIVVSGFLLGQASSAGRTNQDASMSGAAQSKAQPAPNTRPHDASYIIGNSDELAINVWKDQDLTRTIPVRSDGKISLPLVGEVQASGKTPLQLELEITDRLRSYMTDPQVTVMVEKINSKKFNILGQVVKPGSYPLTAPSTVVDAIATAGGFRDFAKKKDVYILRRRPNGLLSKMNFNYQDFIRGKATDQNVQLEPNDTVIVP